MRMTIQLGHNGGQVTRLLDLEPQEDGTWMGLERTPWGDLRLLVTPPMPVTPEELPFETEETETDEDPLASDDYPIEPQPDFEATATPLEKAFDLLLRGDMEAAMEQAQKQDWKRDLESPFVGGSRLQLTTVSAPTPKAPTPKAPARKRSAASGRATAKSPSKTPRKAAPRARS
jgi:hypothetical protein